MYAKGVQTVKKAGIPQGIQPRLPNRAADSGHLRRRAALADPSDYHPVPAHPAYRRRVISHFDSPHLSNPRGGGSFGKFNHLKSSSRSGMMVS